MPNHVAESDALPTLDDTVIEALSQLPSGDGDLLSELAQVFLIDARERLDRLHAAAATRTIDDIEHIAHSLKGMSGAIGALRMQALSEQIERQAVSAPPHIDFRLVHALTSELSRVAAALKGRGLPKENCE